jgi:amidase
MVMGGVFTRERAPVQLPVHACDRYHVLIKCRASREGQDGPKGPVMKFFEYLQHDAVGLAEIVARGEASAGELLELALAQSARAQPKTNTVCRLMEREARTQLEGPLHGPFAGVPFLLKDCAQDFAGLPTTYASQAFAKIPAAEHAHVVRRYLAAGLVIFGKTNLPELALKGVSDSQLFGAVANPWNGDHTPGGSSGGAAAAVAAGVVGAAIGSDGAGSIRIPAAWTGLVGLKPQRGRVSTWPDPEAFNGLSCYGPLARSAADAALLLDAIHGNVPADPHKPPPPPGPFADAAAHEPGRLRVAISFAAPFGVTAKVDDEHRAAIESFARRLAKLGHKIVRTDPPYGLIGPAIVPRGTAGVEEWLSANVEDRGTLEARTRIHGRLGRALSGVPLRLSRAAEAPLRRRVSRVFERCDVVLTPATAKPPPRIGALEGSGYWKTTSTAGATCPFAFAWNVTGWPGISVPAGLTSTGLPIGAQLLGRENDEATLLSLAAQVERAEGGWPQPSSGGAGSS